MDEVKRTSNLSKHGVDFLDVPEMFHGPMLARLDLRKDYQEPRWQGIGAIHGRLMVVAYTKQDSSTIRIISLRKANNREEALFQKTIKDELEKN